MTIPEQQASPRAGPPAHAHTTPEPDQPPPQPSPDPDDEPLPEHAPVKEPDAPEPPVKAG